MSGSDREPDPRTRRGAHRQRRPLLQAVVPSLVAVLAVLALVVSVVVWRGQEATDDALDADLPPAGTPTASTTPTRSSPPTATRSSSPSATTATPPTTTAAPTAPPSPTGPAATGPPPAPRLEVVVLNDTARRGLAATVADQLRRQGWTVAGVSNFRGSIGGRTTVYYPPGGTSAAARLVAELPGAQRYRPRFGNLSRTRLTLVLADDYPAAG